MEHRQLYIDGMTCINCQKKIENCLRKRVEIKEAWDCRAIVPTLDY